MPANRIFQAVFVEAAGADATRLPPEVERRAVERLGWLLLGVSVLFLASIPLRWVTWGKGDDNTLLTLSTLVAGLFASLSALTFVLLRFAKLPSNRVLEAGLVYEVLLCFALALVEQVFVGFSPMPFRISIVAVVLLVFALLVPSPPRYRLIATLLAAAAQPSAMAFVAVLSEGRLPLIEIVLTSAPTLLVGLLAAWTSRVIHRLRIDAGRALSFGQYELVRKLGEGGMGEVWEAKHVKLLRPAALKIIRPETAGLYGESAKARFRREAQATASLSSPHTVELYDYGTTEDGTLYYAMEMLEGVDLERLIGRFGPMPPERVLAILEQVARSLAEAHELGLVHRDIKPANIYLCRLGTELDYVKVLDFGLVKPRFLAEDSPVSVAGAVSGTPGYVAPEHAAGQELDGRADLYSLGCVAYFLLTGQRVFPRRTKLEILTAHLSEEPTPPSIRAPGQGIPAVVDRLVLDLLARDRAIRPVSARALLARVTALRHQLPPWEDAQIEAWWSANLPELAKSRAQLVL